MDVASVVNLGIGGFAILVMWWMYAANRQERKEHFDAFVAQVTEREIAFRSLEKEVRDKIMHQLQDNSRLFEKVVEHMK